MLKLTRLRTTRSFWKTRLPTQRLPLRMPRSPSAPSTLKLRRSSGKNLAGNSRALRGLRAQCKRAKRSLSASIQATTEIDSLFDDIDCSCSIYHARFEELNVGCFGYSVGPVEKTSRDSGIDKKNLHEVIIEKDSAGCWARRPSRTKSRRPPRNKTRSTRTCKQPLRRSLQRQQRRAPSHQLGQAKDALHQV